METLVPFRVRTLSADEVRALNTKPSGKGNKEAFLRATVGLMTKEEADHMERVIEASCERIDD